MANRASKEARRKNLDKQLGRRPLGAPTANNIRRLLRGEETLLEDDDKIGQDFSCDYDSKELSGELVASQGLSSWGKLKEALDGTSK